VHKTLDPKYAAMVEANMKVLQAPAAPVPCLLCMELYLHCL
jgi:hypothetical protein